MKTIFLISFGFVAISLPFSPAWARTRASKHKQSSKYSTPWIPETQYQSPMLDILGFNWMERHHGYVENTKVNGSKARVLFLGDSLTDFYRDQGRAVWQQVWQPLGAVNYGIASDRTEHLLWRITHGEITGLHPKVVVMMIGVNNVWCNKTETDIAKGIATVVAHVRRTLPASKILLLGNTPGIIGITNPATNATPIVANINKMTSKLDDGKHVRFVDATDVFFDKATGTQRSDRFKRDRLHFNEEGYIHLYERIWPMFRQLMGNGGRSLPQTPKEINRVYPVDTSSQLAAAIQKLPGGRVDTVRMCKSTRTH